jgi:hypothetical protein
VLDLIHALSDSFKVLALKNNQVKETFAEVASHYPISQSDYLKINFDLRSEEIIALFSEYYKYESLQKSCFTGIIDRSILSVKDPHKRDPYGLMGTVVNKVK